MNKKEALIVLIKNSYLLTDAEQVNLLANIDSLSEQEIDAVGKLLAVEIKESLENSNQTLKNVDNLLELINAAKAN